MEATIIVSKYELLFNFLFPILFPFLRDRNLAIPLESTTAINFVWEIKLQDLRDFSHDATACFLRGLCVYHFVKNETRDSQLLNRIFHS